MALSGRGQVLGAGSSSAVLGKSSLHLETETWAWLCLLDTMAEGSGLPCQCQSLRVWRVGEEYCLPAPGED